MTPDEFKAQMSLERRRLEERLMAEAWIPRTGYAFLFECPVCGAVVPDLACDVHRDWHLKNLQ